jgi:peptide/nickel transport system permease protein
MSMVSHDATLTGKSLDKSLLSLHKRANRRFWNKIWSSLKKHPQFIICMFIIISYTSTAFLGFIGVLPDFQVRVGESYELPSLQVAKIFGTDIFGRSVFYKVLAGMQTAIIMGFIVTLIAIPIGVILGALAGYYGHKIDAIIIWVYSVIASIPGILLLIAISYSLGKGLFAVCIAMASTYWISLCRMIRGEFIKHRNSEYVLASKVLGASNFSIIFRQVLPNVIHISIVMSSIMVLSAIKAEVMLTYLGVGIQDGASWGSMISAAPGELTNGIWWSLAAVVFFMFLIIYALNIVGDIFRDILDPKLLN